MWAALIGNIRDFYERMFWRLPGAVMQNGAGYTLGFCGKSWFSGVNQLWLDDPAALDVALLDRAVWFFRTYRADWTLCATDDAVKGFCLRHGGFVRWSNPIMLLEGQPQIRWDVSHISIEPVQGAALRRSGRLVLGEAFQMESSDHVMRPEHDDDPAVQHYLAHHRGQPAAAATLTYSPAMAGIWNVGTRRLYRRRGLAHALIARLCADAGAKGYPASMLLASSEGRPLYQSMGYREIGTADYFAFSQY